MQIIPTAEQLQANYSLSRAALSKLFPWQSNFKQIIPTAEQL